ncbi:MAG: hypothetical protein ACPL1A_04335 [Candidatus Kapaibacteriota bacterium]
MDKVGLNIITNNVSSQTKFDREKPLFTKKETTSISNNLSNATNFKIELFQQSNDLTVKSDYELKRLKKNENTAIKNTPKVEIDSISNNAKPLAKFILDYVYGVNIMINFYKDDSAKNTLNQSVNNQNNNVSDKPTSFDILT